MKSENYILCYQALEKAIADLCTWDHKIREMERRTVKVSKAVIKKEKAKYALSKEHARGMYDLAILTGEYYSLLDKKNIIKSNFGWFFE